MVVDAIAGAREDREIGIVLADDGGSLDGSLDVVDGGTNSGLARLADSEQLRRDARRVKPCCRTRTKSTCW